MECSAVAVVDVLEVDIAAINARERWVQTRQNRGALRTSRAALSPAGRIAGAVRTLSKSGLQAATATAQINTRWRTCDGGAAEAADIVDGGRVPEFSRVTCVVLPPLLLLLKEAKFYTEEPDEVQRRELGECGRRRKDMARQQKQQQPQW